MTIQQKNLDSKCYKCNGRGYIVRLIKDAHYEKIPCDVCNGTGKWTENYYYFIDEKQKIAFDSDTLS